CAATPRAGTRNGRRTLQLTVNRGPVARRLNVTMHDTARHRKNSGEGQQRRAVTRKGTRFGFMLAALLTVIGAGCAREPSARGDAPVRVAVAADAVHAF